jgi:hypothetical protein
LEKVLNIEVGLQLFTKTVFPFFENEYNGIFFQRVGKVRCEKLSLKINVRTGIKISEQPCIMNAGMSSSPTDFDGRTRLIDLKTSESQTDAADRESDD